MNPALMQLIAMVGQVGLGELGNYLAGKTEEEAEAILRQVLEQYQGVQNPEFERPADQTVDSAINSDPALREAQLNVLNKLKGMEEGGGFNLESKAALNQILGQAGRQERAGRASIQEGMAARGTGGSGAELAMQMANQQNSANSARDSSLDVAAQAQRSYLQSVMNRGQMSGEVRGQDLREQQARDSIAQYNAQARERGAAARNRTAQQTYDNSMGGVDRQADVRYRQEGSKRKSAQGTRNRFAGYGQAFSEAMRPAKPEDDEGGGY